MKLRSLTQNFLRDEDGTSAVEYAVMLACIVLIAFKSMQLAGFEIQAFYQFSADELGNALD